jgi:hypothetical protein
VGIGMPFVIAWLIGHQKVIPRPSEGKNTDAFDFRSLGGLETDCSQSVAAWGINVGSKLAQGVSKFYTNFFTSTSSPSSYHHQRQSVPTSPTQASTTGSNNEPQKGVVTVLDILRVHKPEREEVNVEEKIDGVVAHFIAHNKVPTLQFNLNLREARVGGSEMSVRT